MEVIAIPPRSIAAFSRRTPARGALATVLCGAACAVLPASLHAQTPAVSPTLGTSITTQWSDFSTPAAGSDQTTGLAAAAAPNGAVDAFEIAGGSPTLAASRTRTQGGEWTDHPGMSPIGKFDKIINVSRSSYGTLIARLVTTNIYAVSIRRPDGTWENRNALQLGQTIYQGSIAPRFTLGPEGTVVFTARTGKQLGVSVMHVGETAWSTVRSVDVDPKTPGSSLTCSASPVATVGAAKATIAIGCPIAGTDRVQAAIIAYDGTVQKTFTMTLPSGSFPSGQLPGTIAMAFDAKEDHLYTVARAVPGGTSAGRVGVISTERLILFDSVNDGASTSSYDFGAAAPAAIAPQTQILTGASGTVTVLQGGRDANGYKLVVADNNQGNTTASAIMSGAAGGFDAYQNADGEQYVLWHRADTLPAAPQGPTATPWPTTKDSVAVMKRSGITGEWSMPEVLSRTARAFSQYYREAPFYAPVLQASGSTLHALWFEDDGSGEGAVRLTEARLGAAPVDPGTGGGTGGTGGGTTGGSKPAPATPGATDGTPVIVGAPLTQAAGSRTLRLDLALRWSGKARKCPTRIVVRVRKLRSNGTLSSTILPISAPTFSTRQLTSGCWISGSVQLTQAQPAGTSVGVVVSARGYRVRAPRITLQ